MFKVQKNMCDQCLFSKDKIVSDSRKSQILKECISTDTHFNCHKEQLNGDEATVCCRGFYDQLPTQAIRIAERLRVVEFVTIK